jgi:hypothetical protein
VDELQIDLSVEFWIEGSGGSGALVLELGLDLVVGVVRGGSLLFGTMGVSFDMGRAVVLSALSQ